MRATQVLLILALMVMLLGEVEMASIESSGKPKCSSVVFGLGKRCVPAECDKKCIDFGGNHGTCIEGPACNCLLCGPHGPKPPPLQQ
ncbi:hypothetical protein BAE44_0008076 [Dichanthelium oligosanthes]|uniref:Knottin scorpion toxin-like domain-containing protein n=1 Tax=Dichanthelium oligosanthes TaxID=888268 RepID=A0A1E5W0I2_9POAL|nr:hypothetical protein BAE44_0008076 [Dichanthelium oligosanthes]